MNRSAMHKLTVFIVTLFSFQLHGMEGIEPTPYTVIADIKKDGTAILQEKKYSPDLLGRTVLYICCNYISREIPEDAPGHAAATESMSWIPSLIQAGADPNYTPDPDERGHDYTPLIQTCASRYLHNQYKKAIIMTLLRNGAEINFRTEKGYTALTLAIKAARQADVEDGWIEREDAPFRGIDMVKLLLECGADPNQPGYKECLPLGYVGYCDYQKIRLLNEYGAHLFQQLNEFEENNFRIWQIRQTNQKNLKMEEKIALEALTKNKQSVVTAILNRQIGYKK